MRHYTVTLAVQFSAYRGVQPCFDAPQQHVVFAAKTLTESTDTDKEPPPPYLTPICWDK